MSTHYTDGRRWSHISNAWILVEGWNDKEEIASLRAQLAYAQNRECPHCASKDDTTFVVECEGCRQRHKAVLAAEAMLSDEQIRSIWQTTDTGEIEDDILSFARSIAKATRSPATIGG